MEYTLCDAAEDFMARGKGEDVFEVGGRQNVASVGGVVLGVAVPGVVGARADGYLWLEHVSGLL